MNLHADWASRIGWQRGCEWRWIASGLTASGLGEPHDPDGHDVYYIGGGQGRDQRLCAEDLLDTKPSALRAAAARDAVILGLCRGDQLPGNPYTLPPELGEGSGRLHLPTLTTTRPRQTTHTPT